MGNVTFADLIARRVPLAASEAAALTLAVARLMDVRRTSGQRVRLPDDEWILLSSSGEVSIVEVHGSLEYDEIASLSALLRRLLRLDDRPAAGRRAIVPGGLLIVLARNLGYIHLPATEPAAFRAALERFAATDPSALAAVFWRAGSCGRDMRAVRPASRRSTGTRTRTDRRHEGASRADLRRALRDLERELYELRGRPTGQADPEHAAAPGIRRTTIAATLAASFLGALTVAALAVTGGGQIPAAARGRDVALTPDPPAVRVVPAVAALPEPVPQRARVEHERPSRDAPAAQVQRTSTARPGRARTIEAPTRGRAKKADPLAAHRGGTRGIAW